MPDRVPVTFEVDEELHRKFKAKCAELGYHMRDVLEEKIYEWVKENK